MSGPRVAFSKDFLTAYSRLPRKIQKKVRGFTEKFQKDPTQPGLNFERIEKARDAKVRSIRVDQAYRVIVVHPPRGDVYLCVWVDHHDDAYRWAMERRFEVNPRSGTFQIFESVVEVPERTPEAPARLLADVDDEDLLMAGVPEPLLVAVRALETDDGLDALAPHLPADAAEMLYLMAAGYSLVDAIEEADRAKPEPVAVDVEDFEAALTKPESQRTFKVVDDGAALESMLDTPLEQWRVFLHPKQRKLVRMQAKGPVRVLGGAGTGKTVVLMHRANHLASNVFNAESDRVLVTTFTRNLALDLQMNLRNLCGPDAFGRLEVRHLHSWAVSFMRKQGHAFQIVSDPERRQLFEEAITEAGDAMPLAFYMDEWDEVVQAQEVISRDDYLTARRVGRGTRLGRRQRADVWEVLARYRRLLSDKRRVEWPDVIRETRLFMEKQNLPSPYRAVLSDEVQDFSGSELRLLRALAPEGNDTLFLVGDGHQRIYGKPVTLKSCGIEVRGRARRLKTNYRTTQPIRDHAVAVLEGKEIDDLDGGVDSLKGYCSLRDGPKPELAHFLRESEESAFIVKKVGAWIEAGVPGEAICVAARTRSQITSRYEKMLQAAGIESVRVETDPESEAKQPGVRLATMHRMKGLEFSRVLLAGVQDGTVPLDLYDGGDPMMRERHELKERCLLYVASTRARDELVVTGYGAESPFMVRGAIR